MQRAVTRATSRGEISAARYLVTAVLSRQSSSCISSRRSPPPFLVAYSLALLGFTGRADNSTPPSRLLGVLVSRAPACGGLVSGFIPHRGAELPSPVSRRFYQASTTGLVPVRCRSAGGQSLHSPGSHRLGRCAPVRWYSGQGLGTYLMVAATRWFIHQAVRDGKCASCASPLRGRHALQYHLPFTGSFCPCWSIVRV